MTGKPAAAADVEVLGGAVLRPALQEMGGAVQVERKLQRAASIERRFFLSRCWPVL